jgi:predicted oxidoreductase
MPLSAKGRARTTAFRATPCTGRTPASLRSSTDLIFAIKMVIGDLGTYAGIKTDPNARALDADDRTIEGLYAVGNDMASIMGGNYPGAGITLGPALTFGYIAGRHIAGGDPTRPGPGPENR